MKIDIIKLAKEAWPEEYRYDTDDRYVTFKFEELQRFSNLVLEEAASVCESNWDGTSRTANICADAIREMKNG